MAAISAAARSAVWAVRSSVMSGTDFRDQAVLVAGGVEVGVDLPQARELESLAQLGER